MYPCMRGYQGRPDLCRRLGNVMMFRFSLCACFRVCDETLFILAVSTSNRSAVAGSREAVSKDPVLTIDPVSERFFGFLRTLTIELGVSVVDPADQIDVGGDNPNTLPWS